MLSRLSLVSVFILFLFIGCAGPRMSTTPEQEADMLYSKASELHSADSFDEASVQFEEYIRRYPESNRADNAKLKIGNGYFLQGKYDEAIAVYQEIIDTYPDSDAADQAMLFMGDANLFQQKNDQAIEAYKKLLVKYPMIGVPLALNAQDRLNAVKDIERNRDTIAGGNEADKDNAQYDTGDIYFTIFKDYERAIDEFKKVVEQWPNSEMADEALLRIGECYWNIASRQLPPREFSNEQLAYINLIEIFDRYPQLARMEMFHLDVHWPAGERGDNYELAYAQARRIINKYPAIKEKKMSDFLPDNYKKSFEAWQDVILKYSHTDTAVIAPERIAKAFTELGNLYYNIGLKHFGCALYRESLMTLPTTEGHLGMARYYASITSVSGQPWAYRRAFYHIKKAEEMTPPDSPLANEVSWAKEWMNYKMRIEALENLRPERR